MDLLAGENRPETCAMLGLDCRICIHKVATSVARICAGLAPSGAQDLFFQLFPSPGCSPMASAFESAYRESLRVSTPDRRSVAAAA